MTDKGVFEALPLNSPNFGGFVVGTRDQLVTILTVTRKSDFMGFTNVRLDTPPQKCRFRVAR